MRKFEYTGTEKEARESLQCGRIYKDAEICQEEFMDGNHGVCFNVAASIKMRKLKELEDYEN